LFSIDSENREELASFDTIARTFLSELEGLSPLQKFIKKKRVPKLQDKRLTGTGTTKHRSICEYQEQEADGFHHEIYVTTTKKNEGLRKAIRQSEWKPNPIFYRFRPLY
jgi:hypothetical protein